jgi:hypothetical protein
MKKADLDKLVGTDTLIAWERSPYNGGGLARVRVVKTGLDSGLMNPRTGTSRIDSSRVEIVSATFAFDDETYHDVRNHELHEWTQEDEGLFSLLNDRAAFEDDAKEASALAGITIASIDPIAQTVTLSVSEFEQVCHRLMDDSDKNMLMMDEGPPPVEKGPPEYGYENRGAIGEPEIVHGDFTRLGERDDEHGGDGW